MDCAIKPQNISILNDCFGCSLCAGICPRNIIELSNENGFIKPHVTDQKKCINCGICLNSCSFNNLNHNRYLSPRNFYSATSKDFGTVKTCTSGGAVYEILKQGLLLNYKIIGVKYNHKTNRPEHFIISTFEDLDETKGSKYLQSDLSNVIKSLSPKDRYIIVGTPCQIASIHHYLNLRKIRDNVILIDFFCHGIPSTILWDKYLSLKKASQPQRVFFRPKDYGWHNSIRVKLETTNACIITQPPNKDVFFSFFLGDRCLSTACYDSCDFKQLNTFADLRVGDLWGQKYQENDTGLSGIISFTIKGDKILSDTKNLSLTNESPATILSGQMTKNARKPWSYKITAIGFKLNCNLKILYYICETIDYIKLIPRRVLNKIYSFLNLK